MGRSIGVTMQPILQTENASKYFGKFAAVKNLNFQVFPNEIFGIAGPNGAGKSTLFNVITNIPFRVTSGRIKYNGKYICKLMPHQICRMGIARTFQIPVFFQGLTTLDNVMIGAYFGKSKGTLGFSRRDDEDPEQESLKILDLVGLLDKKDVVADNLSLFGTKLLMVASALATKPKLLLLDEPIGGLNPVEIEQAMELIENINKLGVTILIIEHIMKALMGLSDRVMILHHGEKISEGTPTEIAEDEKVIEAYFEEVIKL